MLQGFHRLVLARSFTDKSQVGILFRMYLLDYSTL